MTYTLQDRQGIIWRRSLLSNIEVAFFSDAVWVTSSETPDVILKFTKDEWKAFTDGAKDGEFNI